MLIGGLKKLTNNWEVALKCLWEVDSKSLSNW